MKITIVFGACRVTPYVNDFMLSHQGQLSIALAVPVAPDYQ